MKGHKKSSFSESCFPVRDYVRFAEPNLIITHIEVKKGEKMDQQIEKLIEQINTLTKRVEVLEKDVLTIKNEDIEGWENVFE